GRAGEALCQRPPVRHWAAALGGSRMGGADRRGAHARRRRPAERWRRDQLMARVLVVDDAAFMRKMLGDVLGKAGHEVVGEGANGNEAIEQFQALRPDIMTLDITMPEKDGLTALREILSLDAGARVIMCSALGQEAKVLEAIKSGAKDFVVKPFQPDRVVDAIGKAMG